MNSAHYLIKEIQEKLEHLETLPTEVRKALVSFSDHDRIEKRLNNMGLDFKDFKHSLLRDILKGEKAYTILMNEDSLSIFSSYLAFSSTLLETEKKIFFNTINNEFGVSSTFWPEFGNRHSEAEQDKLVPLLSISRIFDKSYLSDFYKDRDADFINKLVEYNKKNSFLLYKTVLWLNKYQPDSKLTKIVDKDIFNYIKDSTHSEKSDSLVFHMLNLYSDLFDGNRNEVNVNITQKHEIALQALNDIATSIDKNINYFSENLPLSVVARNVIIPGIFLYSQHLENNNISDYITVPDKIEHNIDIKNIYNLDYLTTKIKHKSLPDEVLNGLSILFDKELISSNFKDSGALIKISKKNRL